MKLNRRNLRILIESILNENDQFNWPGKKPWWANEVIAHDYDKEAELQYNLKTKFDEYYESFDEEEKGSLAGWEDENLASNYKDPKWAENASRTMASQGDPLSRLYVMFECVHIARKFELKGYQDMYKKWQKMTEFVATAAPDQPSFETKRDARQIQGFLQSTWASSGNGEILDDIQKSKGDKPAPGIGDVKAGDDANPDEFVGYSYGDDSDLKVYTIKGQTGYAYTGTPKEGWVAYKQSDLKKGKIKPTKKFKSGDLDRAYKENTFETNPEMANIIASSQKKLAENLSRGSLYRRKYTRY